MDGDGVRDDNESGISDITVELYDCGTDGICGNGDDQLVASTTTSLDGYYTFGNLADDDYNVRVGTTPSGLVQTYDPDESNPCTTCDNVGLVTISGGNTDLTIDFGYQYSGPNSVSGTVFYDTNDNAIQDPTETTTYDNVTIYLWDSNNILIGTTVTDANGDYSFTDLPDGSYTVSVNPNAPNLSGMSPTETANPTTYRTFNLTGGTDLTDQDFGFLSNLDMGDLPTSYNLTLLDDDGPRHTLTSLFLGVDASADENGQEDPFANADDLDDGVVRTLGVNWNTGANGGSVDITVSGCTGTCYMSAWIDWDQNDTFNDAGDRVLLDLSVSNGTQTITFDIPAGVTFNTSYNARFRIYDSSTTGNAQPNGWVQGGEVEDYQWEFGPTAIRLSSLTAVTSPISAVSVILPLVFTLLGISSLILIKKRVFEL
jgi:hypothetical protein